MNDFDPKVGGTIEMRATGGSLFNSLAIRNPLHDSKVT